MNEQTADESSSSQEEERPSSSYGECPVCLEEMPPYWENHSALGILPCCGKMLCVDCVTEKQNYLKKETRNMHLKSSAEKKQLQQLAWNCPLCRTAIGQDKDREDLLLRHSKEGKGWADWCLCWLYLYENRNPRLSKEYLKSSAERGYPCGLYYLAESYLLGDSDLDIERSFTLAKQTMERAAEVGHTKARYELHSYYIDEERGGHCKKEEADYDKAIQILELAGEEGYGEAYGSLGDIFQNGWSGKEQNYNIAIDYFIEGIKMNDLNSWYMMGCCYEHLDSNREETCEYRESAFDMALVCFQSAAKHGHIESTLEYRKSASDTALLCHQAAANLGHVLSQELLSSMLIKFGEPDSFARGIVWAQIAMNDGSEWAKDLLQSDEYKSKWSGICFRCFAVAKGGESRFHSCSKCKIAHYCSRQCQKGAWGQHKNICGKNNDLLLKMCPTTVIPK